MNRYQQLRLRAIIGGCVRGIQHRPLFQGITRVWRRSGAVMASITIPQAAADDMSGYQMHPALLDSILQGITPFLPDEREDDTYVPVAVQRIRLYQLPMAFSRAMPTLISPIGASL